MIIFCSACNNIERQVKYSFEIVCFEVSGMQDLQLQEVNSFELIEKAGKQATIKDQA